MRVVRVAPRPAMLRHLYRPIKLLVTDSVRVTWVLLAHCLLRRPSSGHFRVARYRAVADESGDVARRILSEWSASLGANRYVIGIDAEHGVLLVHELVWSSGPLDPLELG